MNAEIIAALAAFVTICGGIFATLKWGKSASSKLWHFFSRYKPKVPRETVRVLPQTRGCRWSWGTVRGQPAMHVIGHWYVTNINGDPVHILNARLSKPRTKGHVLTKHPGDNIFGGYPIFPKVTTEVTSSFWVVPPKKKVGKDFVSSVVLTDQYGNEHKIKNVVFNGPRTKEPAKNGLPYEAIHQILDPVEKEIVAVLKAEVNRYGDCGRRVGGLGSIQTTIGGRTYQGLGTEWRDAGSPKNQSIVENEDKVSIVSDNAQALFNFHSRLSEEEKHRFYQALLSRLSKKTEYAPVGYLILYVMFRLGRLDETLKHAKQDLQGDDAYGFSDFLRFLDGLLRFRNTSFTPEMLDIVEKFVDGVDEHTFRITERLVAIRAYRLSKDE